MSDVATLKIYRDAANTALAGADYDTAISKMNQAIGVLVGLADTARDAGGNSQELKWRTALTAAEAFITNVRQLQAKVAFENSSSGGTVLQTKVTYARAST